MEDYRINKDKLKEIGAYLFGVYENKKWETDGFNSMNHFIRFNAEAFCEQKNIPLEDVYAEMLKAFENHKKIKEIEADVSKSVEFEEKLSEFSKESITTFMSIWFPEEHYDFVIESIRSTDGILKNKAGAEVTTQQQPASNLMSN
ncbi:MAG: hypothetical protein ABJ387_01575 [Balneola sp.]